jgi:hypothetical protein
MVPKQMAELADPDLEVKDTELDRTLVKIAEHFRHLREARIPVHLLIGRRDPDTSSCYWGWPYNQSDWEKWKDEEFSANLELIAPHVDILSIMYDLRSPLHLDRLSEFEDLENSRGTRALCPLRHCPWKQDQGTCWFERFAPSQHPRLQVNKIQSAVTESPMQKMANKRRLKTKTRTPKGYAGLATGCAGAPLPGENANDYPSDDSDEESETQIFEDRLARRAAFTREALGWQRFWNKYALLFRNLNVLRVRMPRCFDQTGSWRLAKLLLESAGWTMLPYTDERQNMQTREDLFPFLTQGPDVTYEHKAESRVWSGGRFVRRTWVWNDIIETSDNGLGETGSSETHIRDQQEAPDASGMTLESSFRARTGWAERLFNDADWESTEAGEKKEFEKAVTRTQEAEAREKAYVRSDEMQQPSDQAPGLPFHGLYGRRIQNVAGDQWRAELHSLAVQLQGDTGSDRELLYDVAKLLLEAAHKRPPYEKIFRMVDKGEVDIETGIRWKDGIALQVDSVEQVVEREQSRSVALAGGRESAGEKEQEGGKEPVGGMEPTGEKEILTRWENDTALQPGSMQQTIEEGPSRNIEPVGGGETSGEKAPSSTSDIYDFLLSKEPVAESRTAQKQPSGFPSVSALSSPPATSQIEQPIATHDKVHQRSPIAQGLTSVTIPSKRQRRGPFVDSSSESDEDADEGQRLAKATRTYASPNSRSVPAALTGEAELAAEHFPPASLSAPEEPEPQSQPELDPKLPAPLDNVVKVEALPTKSTPKDSSKPSSAGTKAKGKEKETETAQEPKLVPVPVNIRLVEVETVETEQPPTGPTTKTPQARLTKPSVPKEKGQFKNPSIPASPTKKPTRKRKAPTPPPPLQPIKSSDAAGPAKKAKTTRASKKAPMYVDIPFNDTEEKEEDEEDEQNTRKTRSRGAKRAGSSAASKPAPKKDDKKDDDGEDDLASAPPGTRPAGRRGIASKSAAKTERAKGQKRAAAIIAAEGDDDDDDDDDDDGGEKAAAADADAEPDAVPAALTDYNALTAVKLKALLKERGVKLTGMTRKVQFIAKLEELDGEGDVLGKRG